MQATRVVINPETISKSKLTPKRRRELRRENVLELIKRKPYGKRLLAREVAEVAGITSAGANVFLKNLVRDGYITKHELGLRSAFYTVNEPVSVVKPAVQGVIEEMVKDIEGQEDGRYRNGNPKMNLEERAMRFAWEHPLYNNDLREFIKWSSKEGN